MTRQDKEAVLEYMYQTSAIFNHAVHASMSEFNRRIAPQYRVVPSVYLLMHIDAIPDFVIAALGTQQEVLNELMRAKEAAAMPGPVIIDKKGEHEQA